MHKYFENKFHDAIYTDLHIHDEPDAMISLFDGTRGSLDCYAIRSNHG